MLFKTIELNIHDLNLKSVKDAINDIIYKKYWDKKREDYETSVQMNHRITWINNDFCTLRDLAEINNTTKSYLENISANVCWLDIKHDLLILYDKRDELEREEERINAVNTQIETWKQRIGSIRYDLNKLAIRKKEIYDLINNTNDEKKLKRLYKELENIGNRESQLNKDMDTAQKNQRTALCLTNNYKDTTPDKLELEQKGELNLNAKVTGDLTLAEEEAKADEYFKQLEKEMQLRGKI